MSRYNTTINQDMSRYNKKCTNIANHYGCKKFKDIQDTQKNCVRKISEDTNVRKRNINLRKWNEFCTNYEPDDNFVHTIRGNDLYLYGTSTQDICDRFLPSCFCGDEIDEKEKK